MAATTNAQETWQSFNGDDFLHMINAPGGAIIGYIDNKGALNATGGTVAFADVNITPKTDSTAMFLQDTTSAATGGFRLGRVLLQQSGGAAQASGTNYAFYSKAENHVNTLAGTIVGLAGYAGNYNTSAGGTINAGEFVATTHGVAIGTVRGLYVQIDGDGGGSTVVRASGIEVNMQVASTGITTGPDAIYVSDSSHGITNGVAIAAVLKVVANDVTTEVGCIIDASGVSQYTDVYAGVTLTDGDVPLFAWKDTDGTQHVAVFRDSDDTLVIRS